MNVLRRPIVSRIALHARTYAVSVEPPVVYSGKLEPRVYPVKKTFRYNQYRRMLDASSQSPLIFLHHNKFTIPHLIRLRAAIATAAAKHPSSSPPPTKPTGKGKRATLAQPTPVEPVLPTLTFVRTGIFGVALRNHAPLDNAAAESIASSIRGGLAVLTLPELNPPQLNAILRIIDRTIAKPRVPTPEEIKAREEAAKADPPNPGRRMKRQKPVLDPEMKLLGAFIEGRVFAAPGVTEVAQLPNLHTLHAQLIGLLSSPATQLAGVLSEASGGKLARTLEGLKKGLEEQEDDAGTQVESAL